MAEQENYVTKIISGYNTWLAKQHIDSLTQQIKYGKTFGRQ